MTKNQLHKLKAEHVEWMYHYKSRGGKVTTYFCPHCEHSIVTPKPTRSEVGTKGYWDSAKTCVDCGEVSFVKVWPSGKTEARGMDGKLFKVKTVAVSKLALGVVEQPGTRAGTEGGR